MGIFYRLFRQAVVGPLIAGRLLVALLLIFVLGACYQAEARSGRVSWVYDSDTLEVQQIGKVRLLGIDSPELKDSDRDRFYRQQFGISPATLRRVARQATEFVIRHARNQTVTLEFDHKRTDPYGRTLAYVYLPDGQLLNQMLIEEGLAVVFRRADFALKDQFLAAEARAREKKLGLWR